MWFTSSKKNIVGVCGASFDVNYLSCSCHTTGPALLNNACPVSQCEVQSSVLDNLVTTLRRAVPWLEGDPLRSVRCNAFADYVVVHSIPSATILYRVPLSTGKCNVNAQYMNACFTIYKTAVLSGNGDRVVQSAFPILHVHNSTYTNYKRARELER